MSNTNVIYEVNAVVDPARVVEYDAWLVEHVQDMLGLPGFLSAEQFASVTDEGSLLRSVQYRLEDEHALQAYLEGDAARMRSEASDRFHDDLRISRRILNPTRSSTLNSCLNCGAPLAGQYCVECGQRHRARMISVFELLRDVFDDLLSWDSRMWRSLRPLLLRPGRLTNEYLNGRRMYYTPPLRMYLVLSVIFFLLTSLTTLGSLDDSGFVIDGDGVGIRPTEQRSQQEAADALRELAAARRELGALSGNSGVAATADEGDVVADVAQRLEAAAAAQESESDAFDCSEIELDVSPFGLDEQQLRELLIERCERFTAPGGRKALLSQFIDIIPSLLIVMLPLIALASKLLYLFSGRYYVEHLLVFTHYHSFAFLYLMLLMGLFTLIGQVLALSGAITPLKVAAWAYAVYYPYRALRVVFHQGRLVTIIKLGLLAIVYFIGASLLTVVGMLIAVFSA